MEGRDLPAHYAVWDRTSAFLDLIGPIYISREGGKLSLAMRLDERHTNRRGTAHGGLLTSVADVALGHAAALTTDPPASLVTVNLAVDFMATARIGAWVEFLTRTARLGRRLAFSEGSIVADDKMIARTSAILAVQRSPS